MARATPKGKLSKAARLRELAEKQLEEANRLEEQLIAPTRNKLRDLMLERVDKFLRDNVEMVPSMKFDRDKLGASIEQLLQQNLIANSRKGAPPASSDEGDIKAIEDVQRISNE